MATNFAVPTSIYEKVSRTNRQRRAAGRLESEDSGYNAYRAAIDTVSARSLDAQRIADAKEIADRRLDLTEEAIDDQNAAAMVSGAVSLAQTGVMAYDKLAPHFASNAAPTASPVATTPLAATPTPAPALPAASTGAQAAIAGAEAGHIAASGAQTAIAGAEAGHIAASGASTAATGAAAAEGGTGMAAGSAGAGLAAGVGVAAIEATKEPVAEWAQDTFGGEADDVVGIAARVGQGAVIGAAIGGGYGAAAGAAIGGVVGIVEEVADGSHICTATHNSLGLRNDVIISMGLLRKYAAKNHPAEIEYYLKNCPRVLRAMGYEHLLRYLNEFKTSTAEEVSTYIEAGDLESAYQVYMKKAEEIFVEYDSEYNRELFMETA